MSKYCTRCRELKEGFEYYKKPTARDGLTSRCKKCIIEVSKQSKFKNDNNMVTQRDILIKYLLDNCILSKNMLEELLGTTIKERKK